MFFSSSHWLITQKKTNLSTPVSVHLMDHRWHSALSSNVERIVSHSPLTCLIFIHKARVAPLVQSDGFHRQGVLYKVVRLAHCFREEFKCSEGPTCLMKKMNVSLSDWHWSNGSLTYVQLSQLLLFCLILGDHWLPAKFVPFPKSEKDYCANPYLPNW